MKKSFKVLGIFLALILVLTGCGKKEDKKKNEESNNTEVEKVSLESAIEKTSKVKSLKLKAKFDTQVAMQGVNMSIVMEVSGEAKDNNSHFTTKASSMGIEQNSELYTVVKDNSLYTYQKDEKGKWVYSKAEYKEENSTGVSIEKITNMLKETKSNKEVNSDKEGYTKYEIVVDGSKLGGLLGGEESTASAELKDLTVNIYVKDGYVSIINIDLTDAFKSSMGSSLTEGSSITSVLNVEITDFDKVNDITVPEDVVKNATETKEIENEIFDLLK